MLRSATEGNLPVLPGIRQYVPKRKTFGRHTLFDIGADGVMLQREKYERPSSTPSSQQGLIESFGSKKSFTTTISSWVITFFQFICI